MIKYRINEDQVTKAKRYGEEVMTASTMRKRKKANGDRIMTKRGANEGQNRGQIVVRIRAG